MGRDQRVWLLAELPRWVEEGVIDDAAAGRLRARYAADAEGRSWGVIVLGILGALLIGLGVIMLLAYNWQDLSRPARTALAFLPLALTQLLAWGWHVRWGRNAAWRETIAILWALAIGASISLIAQTYHMPGDLEGFVLVWACLTLPVVWFMQAATALVLEMALLLIWASFSQLLGGAALFFWPLAAAVVPAICAARRAHPDGSRVVWMLWITALACTAALGITLEKAMPGLWMLTYAGAFAVLYLFETRGSEEALSLWRRPLHSLGVFGIAVLAYLLTFEWPWREIGWRHYRSDPAFDSPAAYFDYALAVGLPLLAGLLLALTARRGMRGRAVYGALPVVVAAGYAVGGYDLDASGFIQSMLFNGYLFLLGIWTLVQGVAARRLRTINGGMTILIALILTRFFDSELSLAAKGIVFILLGAAFMIVNLAHLRRRKAVRS